MKITAIETFVVDAGWRPWQYVAVRTDEGITGYGEMSDGRNPYGIVGAVTDFFPILKGQDPLAVEKRYWDMYRLRQAVSQQRQSLESNLRCGTLRANRSGFQSTRYSAAQRAKASRSTGHTAAVHESASMN